MDRCRDARFSRLVSICGKSRTPDCKQPRNWTRLRDAVRLMIAFSDNTATNLVLDQIEIPSTNARMEKLGFTNTKINAKVFKGSTTSIAPERTKKFGLGSTTAREMIRLLEFIESGKVVSAEACQEMIAHLKACDDKEKMTRLLPAGTVVAHKTGSVNACKTDAGIIYLKSGPVALCILTDENKDERWVADNAGQVLIDYLEISDDIARHRPPVSMVLRYVQASLSPIILAIVPFAFLVAALVTVASLVRSAETTALLAHGVSLYRTTAPILVLAVIAGGLLFLFAERVVPTAASEADRLRFLLKGQTPPASNAGGVWFRGDAGRFYSADAYDPVSRIAVGVSVFQIDPSTWRLVSRHDAARARLAPGKGLLGEDGWIRTFAEGHALAIRRDGPFFIDAPESVAGFASGQADPRQMTYRELSRFIEVRRRAGAGTAMLATGLHQKTAGAASALLLTLVGLPFAFAYGKRGAVAGVGVALFLGLTYLFLSALLVSFGEQGAIPPLIAAWAPNVFFGLGAAWGLLGIRT